MSEDAAIPQTTIRKALWEARGEAHWQRGHLNDDYTSQEQVEMSIASVIAAFLKSVPAGLDAGTLLAEVQEIANG
jgi:hypothetical protein